MEEWRRGGVWVVSSSIFTDFSSTKGRVPVPAGIAFYLAMTSDNTCSVHTQIGKRRESLLVIFSLELINALTRAKGKLSCTLSASKRGNDTTMFLGILESPPGEEEADRRAGFGDSSKENHEESEFDGIILPAVVQFFTAFGSMKVTCTVDQDTEENGPRDSSEETPGGVSNSHSYWPVGQRNRMECYLGRRDIVHEDQEHANEESNEERVESIAPGVTLALFGRSKSAVNTRTVGIRGISVKAPTIAFQTSSVASVEVDAVITSTNGRVSVRVAIKGTVQVTRRSQVSNGVISVLGRHSSQLHSWAANEEPKHTGERHKGQDEVHLGSSGSTQIQTANEVGTKSNTTSGTRNYNYTHQEGSLAGRESEERLCPLGKEGSIASDDKRLE